MLLLPCLMSDSPAEAPGPEPVAPEDMSLSSTSSLDRNDTSQEYMDDFDNLGETSTKATVSFT